MYHRLGIGFISTLCTGALLMMPLQSHLQAKEINQVIGHKSLQRITNEYIVLLQHNADSETLSRLINAVNGFNKKAEPTSVNQVVKLQHINGFAGQISDEAIAMLQQSDKVKSIEVNRRLQVPAIDDEQLQGVNSIKTAGVDSWALDRIDQMFLPLDNQYQSPHDGSGAHAYILSTGIKTTHNQFGGRASWVFSASDIREINDDLNGQGTIMAGIVGSQQWGVAKGVNLYGVKVLDQQGQGSLSGLIEGINYVTQSHQKPAVAVLSVSTGYSPALNEAVKQAISAGVSFALPSGDVIRDACDYSPGSVTGEIDGAVTVSVSSRDDEVSIASNFGPCVDIYAPGLYVKSAWPSTNYANNTGSHSPVAASVVAGVQAVIRGADKGCSVTQVKQRLMDASHTGLLSNVPAQTNNLLVNVPQSFGESCVATSCKMILDNGLSTGDGEYLIDPDGDGGQEPFYAYCDMTTDDGGWTLVGTYPKHEAGGRMRYEQYPQQPDSTPNDPSLIGLYQGDLAVFSDVREQVSCDPNGCRGAYAEGVTTEQLDTIRHSWGYVTNTERYNAGFYFPACSTEYRAGITYQYCNERLGLNYAGSSVIGWQRDIHTSDHCWVARGTWKPYLKGSALCKGDPNGTQWALLWMR